MLNLMALTATGIAFILCAWMYFKDIVGKGTVTGNIRFFFISIVNIIKAVFKLDLKLFINSLKILVSGGFVICFALLVITGFFNRLFFNKIMTGYWMLGHTTLAGIFLVVLFLFLLFNMTVNLKSQKAKNSDTGINKTDKRAEILKCVFFWLMIAVSLPLISSIALSMLPLFSEHIQEYLLAVHRYSGVAFIVAALPYLYLVKGIE